MFFMFGDNEILVADANFLGMRKTSFNEIFDSGKYDTLRLITYSATFDQIYRIPPRKPLPLGIGMNRHVRRDDLRKLSCKTTKFLL